MKLLIVSKKSNLERYEHKVKPLVNCGALGSYYLEDLEKNHLQHYETLNNLKNNLKKSDINFVEISRGISWPKLDDISYIVTIGGDGTLLEASHHVIDHKIPIIGICSSSESIGHLCSYSRHEIDSLVVSLQKKSFSIKKLHRMIAIIDSKNLGTSKQTEPILNDFLYTNKNPALTTRYSISLNQNSETHKSSGIWFATASGSTAAISAAGGKEMEQSSNLFQFLVREPYTPPQENRNQLVNELFDPDRDKFFIENFNDNAMLAFDGQHGYIDLHYGDIISFKRAQAIEIMHSIN